MNSKLNLKKEKGRNLPYQTLNPTTSRSNKDHMAKV